MTVVAIRPSDLALAARLSASARTRVIRRNNTEPIMPAISCDSWLGVVEHAVAPVGPDERVCPSCHLIVASHLMVGTVCVDCCS